MLVGSNAAWCHPVLFQRMQENRRERGAKLVVIDPRRTATADEADLHLADRARHGHRAVLRPAGASRRPRRARPRLYRRAHDRLRGGARARARDRAANRGGRARDRASTTADVARSSTCSPHTERVVTCYSQGVNQSAQGTDKVNAIINCHLATGRIGRPGMGPFSLTGQPNAMGGREVGGLANQLAAHMGFAPAEIDRVRRFWSAPHIATREGLKAVEMFEAIERGEIKALWVMATNPAVSLPRAARVREALQQARTVRRLRERASNDTVERRRACAAAGRRLGREGRHGHQFRAPHLAPARLPAAAGRGASPTGGSSREVARRMGFGDAFAYALAGRDFPRARGAVGVRERRHARFRSSARSRHIDDADYDALAPVQWPVRAGRQRDGDALLRRRRLLHARPQGALRRARSPGAAQRAVERTSRSCSTPAACATSGTP